MGKFSNAFPSAKFPTKGTKVTGKVSQISESPVPEFNNAGRIVSNTGNVMQVDVVLVNGIDTVVLHTAGAIYFAIGAALRKIGADDLEVGDTLTVEYTGDGEPTAEGYNPPKEYTATVVKA